MTAERSLVVFARTVKMYVVALTTFPVCDTTISDMSKSICLHCVSLHFQRFIVQFLNSTSYIDFIFTLFKHPTLHSTMLHSMDFFCVVALEFLDWPALLVRCPYLNSFAGFYALWSELQHAVPIDEHGYVLEKHLLVHCRCLDWFLGSVCVTR